MPESNSVNFSKKFWSKVDKTDSCWNWTAYIDRSGYGCMHLNGGVKKAHRLVFEMLYGKVPYGMLVRHTCDNPKCVNPDHLVLGTHKDNALDREARGRNGAPKGSASRMSLLTEREVETIRWLREQNISLDKIAILYHMSKSAIWGIVNKRTWKHVP